MATSIKNKRVIVTGGANGIGYSCVSQLLQRGVKAVAILDMDTVAGNEAVKKLNAEVGQDRVIFFATNVSITDYFKTSFEKAVEALGGLDIMINNAGILNDVMKELTIDTNVKSVIQGSLMAINLMGKHRGGNGGTIINMGSILSFMTSKYVPIYTASKHAVIGFTMSIAKSFPDTGVAVKAMCPSVTDTTLVSSKAARYLDFVDQDAAVEFICNKPRQRTDVVATAIMRLIEEAPNAAIWCNTLETSTISLNIPSFQEWGTPI